MNKNSLFKLQYAKLLLALFLTVFSTQSIRAALFYDAKVNGIYYIINFDSKVSVCQGDGDYSGEIVIPSTVVIYDSKNNKNVTYTVTEIYNGAFQNCTSVTSIEIPESVTSIGGFAFNGCSSLTSIKIPESVTGIGQYAFNRCTSLTSIEIPNSVWSYYPDFDGCTSLVSVKLPKKLKMDVNTYLTFRSCSSLVYVEIPENFTEIMGQAFAGCTSLTTIEIPKNVASIGNHAFQGCSSLLSMVCYAENIPTSDGNPFPDITLSKITLYVPSSVIEKYKADTNKWASFGQILPIEGGVELSVGETGLATYCPIVNIDLSDVENIAAYRAEIEGNTVNLKRIYKVHAGEGVLLRSLDGGAATETAAIAVGNEEAEPNDFVGVVKDIYLTETDEDNTNFVLSRQEDGNIGFYKANNTLVPAGKAYLPVPNYNPTEASAKGLRLVFDDDTATDIDIAEAKLAEEDGAYYTLSGVKVENPTAKGIYIKNGKKYIIK